MAARRAQQKKDVATVVESAEDLAQQISQSDKVLLVLDVHKGWCGPTDVMVPTYERAFLDYDDFENRARFLLVSEDILSKEQRDSLPLQEGCKPLFVFYKHKVIIGKIFGANAPEIEAILADNIFPKREEE